MTAFEDPQSQPWRLFSLPARLEVKRDFFDCRA